MIVRESICSTVSTVIKTVIVTIVSNGNFRGRSDGFVFPDFAASRWRLLGVRGQVLQDGQVEERRPGPT